MGFSLFFNGSFSSVSIALACGFDYKRCWAFVFLPFLPLFFSSSSRVGIRYVMWSFFSFFKPCELTFYGVFFLDFCGGFGLR